MQEIRNSRYLYLLYIVFMVANPFAAYTGIDKGHRIVFVLEIITLIHLYCKNKFFKQVFCYKLNLVWFLLIVYHWINCIIHEVPLENGYILEFYPIFSSFMILVMSCYLYIKNPRVAPIVFLVGLLLYILFAVMAGHYQEDSSGNLRLTGSIHMNQLGQAAGFCLFLVAVIKQNLSKNVWSKVCLLSLLPLYTIIQTGSRNAFIMGLLALTTFFFSRTLCKNISYKMFLKIIIMGVFIYFVINLFVQNSVVGQRLLGTSEQAEMQDTFYKTGTFFDLLGDRGWYYYVGIKNFLEHPFFGIGMWNFQFYNHAGFPLHTEYMIHIAEGGIVASLLYYYFIYKIAKGLYLINIKGRTELSIILGLAFLTYLIVCLTARAFYYCQFYVLMGITIAVIMKYDSKMKL